jgi:hypothetical protein
MHGTGYCDGEDLSAENMSDTVGIQVVKSPDDTVKLTLDASHADISDPLPVFCIADPDAYVLARAENGEAIAARRKNAIFISSSYLTVELAKIIISQTDAHIWCKTGEPVLAAAGCLLICAQHEGERIISLPSGDEIVIASKAYETLVIDTKGGDRIL